MPLALRLLVSLRFQFLFHSPHWGTFHLSLTVLVPYRSPDVFSLGEWTHAAGVVVSFDVNYRAKLWSATSAGEKLRRLIREADILFCKGADAAALFDCDGEPRELMMKLKGLTQAGALLCTFGEQGAALLCNGEFVTQPAIPVQIVDRIGSGDAFAAGVLDGWLSAGASLSDLSAFREGLRRGAALAAIALSQFGDRVLSSRAELNTVLTTGRLDIAR